LTYISLVVGDPQEILGQQLRPHPIHLININIISITYFIIYFEIIKLKKQGPLQPKLKIPPPLAHQKVEK
jgi:hypothetical protein